ncbi:hypothetical protein RB195_016958 [Necator americanus]|uniref:Uncharacterized protein n=1 Tax=Necator americanus TaxID=51031 RepID=A0ABR1C4D9_NECAM
MEDPPRQKLLLKENAVPVSNKKRKVRYDFVPDLDAEIGWLVAEEMIFPTEHSDGAYRCSDEKADKSACMKTSQQD